jgi:hypothetical protein
MPDDDKNGTGLAKWVKTDLQPITLEAGARENISFAINVPKENAQPGGHYGAILFATTPPKADGTVGIGGQLGCLMLLRVSGDVKEAGVITEFGFSDKKLWYNYRPIDMFVRFENDGNSHLRPTGNLFIKNWYGRQVATLKVNDKFASVLPHSIRKFGVNWEGKQRGDDKGGFISELKKEWNNFGFGKYHAQLVLTYGTKNQLVGADREFTIWPWRIMLVVALILVVAALIFFVGMKRYNEGVIKRYERRMKRNAK